MNIDTEFNKAVDYVKNSEKMNIDNNTKLFFYAHYKQATIGKCNIDRPNGLFDISNKLKYDAWKQLDNMSCNEAKKKYVEKLKLILTSK
jgi:acyl-CoA-binding protein